MYILWQLVIFDCHVGLLEGKPALHGTTNSQCFFLLIPRTQHFAVFFGGIYCGKQKSQVLKTYGFSASCHRWHATPRGCYIRIHFEAFNMNTPAKKKDESLWFDYWLFFFQTRHSSYGLIFCCFGMFSNAKKNINLKCYCWWKKFGKPPVVHETLWKNGRFSISTGDRWISDPSRVWMSYLVFSFRLRCHTKPCTLDGNKQFLCRIMQSKQIMWPQNIVS